MTLGDWQWLAVGWTLDCSSSCSRVNWRVQLVWNHWGSTRGFISEWFLPGHYQHSAGRKQLLLQCSVTAECRWCFIQTLPLLPKPLTCAELKETAPQLQKCVRTSAVCQCSPERMGSCWEQAQLKSWCCWTPSMELSQQSQLLQRAEHIQTELLIQSKIIQCVKDWFLFPSAVILTHF